MSHYSSGTRIPPQSRALVRHRARGRCERCGSPLGAEWHHRRSRRVKAAHRHCPCNGVWLCRTCHVAVHTRPEAETNARRDGFVLSQWADDPSQTMVATPWGTRIHDCEGSYRFPLIPTETGATE